MQFTRTKERTVSADGCALAHRRIFLNGMRDGVPIALGTVFPQKLIIAYDVTDELFGITTFPGPGCLNRHTVFSIPMVTDELRFCFPAAPAWAFGTAFGIMAGNALPLRAVSALSVALYGMFLAIIIPPHGKIKSLLS